MDLKEEVILEEALKIIDSNKSKASILRNSMINLNQNIYVNNLNLQIIQFLGEFEYDLKSLIELLNDFKNKIKINLQNKLKFLKKELNNIKKENISLKKLKDNNISKFKSKTRLNIRNAFENKIKKNKNKTTKNTENLDKKENISLNNVNSTQAKIVYSNKNNKNNNFCDYNSFISKLKKNNSKFIKYDNYKQNTRRIQSSVRSQSANSKIIYNNKHLDEEKKQKIINEIFQDEIILNALKKQFGKEIEDKLLNGEINNNFLLKIEEIENRIKKSNYNTIQIKNKKDPMLLEYNNKSLNLRVPKRYSNHEDNNSINKFIIS